jgi:hypothetical protein
VPENLLFGSVADDNSTLGIGRNCKAKQKQDWQKKSQ